MALLVSPADHPIAARRNEFVDAMRAHDAATASSVYADDAHLLPPLAGAVHGRSEIRRFWQAGLDSGIAEITLDADGFREHDGMAYEFGRYTLRVEPADGEAVIERGHYVQIHERQVDGSWQRAVETFSPGGGE